MSYDSVGLAEYVNNNDKLLEEILPDEEKTAYDPQAKNPSELRLRVQHCQPAECLARHEPCVRLPSRSRLQRMEIRPTWLAILESSYKVAADLKVIDANFR